MGFLNFIFVLFLVFLLFRIIFKYVFPFFLVRWIKRRERKYNKMYNKPKKEGEINIEVIPEDHESTIDPDAGEYIDFEEVDD